ncbi:MAG: ABC transporter ATP-binding protein [Dethiobacteria bacterium]|nr:ABC transporter ATP-binding protein [Bacillota bacterium]HOL15020.1 ABC transporter ATP-binding protein [Bacillota bacterium]
MSEQNNFHREEDLEKTLDLNLLKRLLEFARPYTAIILICILLLAGITFVELARPYILEIAIDKHINAYSIPLVAFEPGEEPLPGLQLEGEVLIRESELDRPYRQLPRRQVVFYRGEYYLVEGTVDQRGPEYRLEAAAGSTYVLRQGKRSIPAIKLNSGQLSLLRGRDIAALYRLGLIFFLLILAGFILNYLQVCLLQYAGQKIIYDIRMKVFTHLQSLSLSFFDRNPVGRLVTRVANDTETLNEMFTSVIVNLFKDIFLLAGILLAMLQMDRRLALVSMVTLPLIGAATVLFRIKARQAYRQVRTKLAAINADLQENISGMRIIQIFNQQLNQYRQFDRINREHYQANMQEVWTFAVFRPTIDLFQSFAIAVLLWYGGGQVIRGALQFGVLFAFINYIQQFFRPISSMTEKYNVMQSAMASSERIFQLLDRSEIISDPDMPVWLPEIKGRVELKNVWFAYEGENWVLKDVSLAVEPNQTVALVGATGAGKSSIINLLSRFYDAQKGSILIDGIDIRRLKKEELRRQIGVILQDVFLFSDTIAGNISLNNEEISLDQVKHAARLVHADDFISRLPDKYRHQVEERGATLSAGERQLLAFARALAYDPRILILDEATSNIDTATELLIQEALKKLARGRTTIIVAHRLSTIQHADKIVVIHKGRIRETGSHQELLNQGGIYYDLYRLQYKDQLLAE